MIPQICHRHYIGSDRCRSKIDRPLAMGSQDRSMLLVRSRRRSIEHYLYIGKCRMRHQTVDPLM